ncbi:MAG: hypothetical protein AB1Z29_14130, partial [Desulfobacterales bacterium]
WQEIYREESVVFETYLKHILNFSEYQSISINPQLDTIRGLRVKAQNHLRTLLSSNNRQIFCPCL